jgi:hypothetical protein
MNNGTKTCPHCKAEYSPTDWPDKSPCPSCGRQPTALSPRNIFLITLVMAILGGLLGLWLATPSAP